jgi:hypothetical protein
MHFAISIPQHVPDGTFDPARLRDYLTRAESRRTIKPALCSVVVV